MNTNNEQRETNKESVDMERSDCKSRYYADGVIKELWMESNKRIRFTFSPDKECAIVTECSGEKTTCGVFRPEDICKHVRSGKIVELYAGDIIFSVAEGMTFDQLLLIKINGCHIRVYVERKDFSPTHDNGQIPVSEIRLK